MAFCVWTFVVATSVVACFLVFILVQLLCVLLWRRRLRSEYAASDCLGDPYKIPSKELLYFLCWKTNSRIEPASAASTPAGGARSPAPPLLGDGDSLQLQGVHGPSRFLFTIKEEREELEAEEAKLPEAEKMKMNLKECLVVGMEEGEREAAEETPFSTPCASPPFYTPRSSPLRGDDDVVGNLTQLPEDDDVVGKFSGFISVIVD